MYIIYRGMVPNVVDVEKLGKQLLVSSCNLQKIIFKQFQQENAHVECWKRQKIMKISLLQPLLLISIYCKRQCIAQGRQKLLRLSVW
jgi:hypothetical protein